MTTLFDVVELGHGCSHCHTRRPVLFTDVPGGPSALCLDAVGSWLGLEIVEETVGWLRRHKAMLPMVD